MSHLIDVLSSRGLRTGEILPRPEIHRLGKCHRVVRLYLFNQQNELLLQRRSLTVDHAPGLFTISALGHINAGEFSSDTVQREIEEELGIDASQLQLRFLFSYFQEAVVHETYIDRQFNDIYIARVDIQAEQIQFDQGEVSEVKFVSLETFEEMLLNDSLLAAVYADEWRDITYFLDGWR